MIDLTEKVSNRKPTKRVIKKECDHASKINSLETALKSKENELSGARDDLVVALKAKEKVLQQTTSAIKSCRAETALIRK